MALGIFPEYDEDAVYLSRTDALESLSSYSKHPFELEGHVWPSVEHYYQAMKFTDAAEQAKVRAATNPRRARRLGRSRFRKIREDWKQVKVVMMTRAVYTKCRAHPEVAEHLLGTGNQRLVESNQYDYYWGCGRDRRGNNMYGKVLMNVRDKLREERAVASTATPSPDPA